MTTEYRTDGPAWWRLPSEDDYWGDQERADSVIDCARNLETVQEEVHQQNLWNAQLYSNRELAAFDWGSGALYRASLAPISRLGENLVLQIVDTLVAQVGKNRPKATPITRGASWKLRLQAKRLDKWLYGEFMRNRVYDKGKIAFRDAAIFGFGCIEVCIGDDGCPYLERVFPDEILIDQCEVVATGRIRHLYRRRVLPVEVVSATYGVDIEDLLASAEDGGYLEYRPIGKGWIVVVEAYQLPDGDAPGRHVVAIKGQLLKDDPWTQPWLPYVFYHWQTPLSGFYSPSVVEQALPYQVRLNEINEVIRDAQDLVARPRLLVAEGSRVNPMELDNLLGRVIKFTGIKPEPLTWDAINAELYNERDRVVRTARDQFGLSGMATTAAPPPAARFDSSAAFREFNAIQDDRLADPAQRFERFYLDLAEMMVRMMGAYGKDGETVWYSGGRRSRAETIKWSDIDLDENAYTLQLEASSIFNMTPAAAKDEVERMLVQQIISPEEYRRLLAHPDLENEASVQAAAAEDLDRVIELLEEGKYETPTQEQDLINGVQRVTLAMLNLRKYDDVDPEIELNMLNWLAAARAWLERGTEQDPTMPQPPAMMGPGPAAPMPGAGPALPMVQ